MNDTPVSPIKWSKRKQNTSSNKFFVVKTILVKLEHCSNRVAK